MLCLLHSSFLSQKSSTATEGRQATVNSGRPATSGGQKVGVVGGNYNKYCQDYTPDKYAAYEQAHGKEMADLRFLRETVDDDGDDCVDAYFDDSFGDNDEGYDYPSIYDVGKAAAQVHFRHFRQI